MNLTPTPPDPAVIDYIENDPEWRDCVMSMGPWFFELKPSHDTASESVASETCSDECWQWLVEDGEHWRHSTREARLAFLAFENTGNHRAEV